MPICGRTPTFFGVLEDQPELGVLLDDRDDVAPDLLGEHRHLDELGVLEAVADDRRVVVRLGRHRQQLRLGAGLEAEAVLAAEIEHFLDDLPLLVHLDRVDADVAALVLVLGDRGLEGVVDVADAVAEDVAEPDEHRQLDAAQQQVVGELLQVDGARRVLGRVDEHMPGRGDREVALTPPLDLVELGRVADGKDLSRLPVAVTPRRGCAHAIMIRQLLRSAAQRWRKFCLQVTNRPQSVTSDSLRWTSGHGGTAAALHHGSALVAPLIPLGTERTISQPKVPFPTSNVEHTGLLVSLARGHAIRDETAAEPTARSDRTRAPICRCGPTTATACNGTSSCWWRRGLGWCRPLLAWQFTRALGRPVAYWRSLVILNYQLLVPLGLLHAGDRLAVAAFPVRAAGALAAPSSCTSRRSRSSRSGTSPRCAAVQLWLATLNGQPFDWWKESSARRSRTSTGR